MTNIRIALWHGNPYLVNVNFTLNSSDKEQSKAYDLTIIARLKNKQIIKDEYYGCMDHARIHTDIHSNNLIPASDELIKEGKRLLEINEQINLELAI